MTVTHREPMPAADACRPFKADHPAPSDFPTEWTIAPPGASQDDSGSGPELSPEFEVPRMAEHST